MLTNGLGVLATVMTGDRVHALADKYGVIREYVHDNESIDVEVPDGAEETTLAFSTDGSFVGHVACNNYTGAYTTADDGGITASNVGVTQQACEPDEMAVQTTYLSDLALVAQFELDGDALLLNDADGAELLRYDRDQ